MDVLLFLLFYLVGGWACFTLEVRSNFKKMVADPDEERYVYNFGYPHQRERTEEDRVKACMESASKEVSSRVFWLWPLYLFSCCTRAVSATNQWLLASRELKKARELDSEKKTKELLARMEEDEKKKFDGL